MAGDAKKFIDEDSIPEEAFEIVGDELSTWLSSLRSIP